MKKKRTRFVDHLVNRLVSYHMPHTFFSGNLKMFGDEITNFQIATNAPSCSVVLYREAWSEEAFFSSFMFPRGKHISGACRRHVRMPCARCVCIRNPLFRNSQCGTNFSHTFRR